ncbi:uncharacterized protein [Rutidosis leptorrhynchoides]|uniref:uncharacterized protein n=1 Tax=Rutidosis leptorrhynchoides TaxID=125765 RepID=UPI003A99A6B9
MWVLLFERSVQVGKACYIVNIIDSLKAAAFAFELKAESVVLDEGELLQWKDSRKQWLEKERIKSEMLKQKARVKWILEGDENTKYFHSIIRRKNNKSKIRGLSINGVWNNNPVEIKEEVFRHFKKIFEEPNMARPSMEDFNYQMFSSIDVASLEAPFDDKEIRDAVFECSGTKAPGPDGFNLRFYKKIWDIIKVELIDAIRWVVPSLVGIEQSAFLKGRFILDGAHVVNESIDFLKAKGKKGVIFKVDFEKAFDSINWEFLMEVMKCMGFGVKWRRWIMACIKSASISILVNGSPTKEFSLERGIRQGDPLSPFLFLLASEGLNIMTKVTTARGRVSTDDTIFLGEWSSENVINFQNLLKCFELTSGLKVNFHKSFLFGIGVGVGVDEVRNVASILGSQVGSLPFTYLGLPIGAKMKNLKNWNPVIDKIKGRLSSWKMRTMSFGGRLWWWRFYTEADALWAKIIRSIYGPCGGLGLDSGSIRSLNPSTWRDILIAGTEIQAMGIPFRNSFVHSVAATSSVSFWDGLWISGSKLSLSFPRLYRLELNKEASIHSRVSVSAAGAVSFSWEWCRVPTGRTFDELIRLQDLIAGFEFSNSSDFWSWSLANNGFFSVKKLAAVIDDASPSGTVAASQTMRNNLVPKKLEVFSWRATQKLWNPWNMLSFFCKKAHDLWSRVFAWWGIGNFSNLSMNELLRGNCPVSSSSLGRKIWQAVEWTCAYYIWRHRNKTVFRGETGNIPVVFNEIQVKSFDWISLRLKKKKLDWLTWLNDPSVYLKLN